MRVRILGQYLPASLAVLAIVEALLAFVALYAAVCIRFQVGVSQLPKVAQEFGPLWPRGIAFSAIIVTCLLAFGLYNSRQRTRLSGILARLLLALSVSSCAIAALFYAIPSHHLFRGVAALAIVLVTGAVLTSRLVFARVADEEIFKRRVLVYGAGYAAAAITRLRRQADRNAFALAGFVQPPGEECAVPSERLLDSAGDLCALCERLARAGNTSVTVERVANYPACKFDAACVSAVREAARKLGLRHMDIVSGAGHDAIFMARVAPTSMIFVPCEGGVSHNETENAKPEDLAAGCNVLLNVILDRARIA